MGSIVSPAETRPWIETPCIYSHELSQAAGCQIYLKLECLQPSGSFKARSIGHLMARAAVRSRPGGSSSGGLHFYCSSGGNAGLACAVAARHLGASATIVVPDLTSAYMVARLRAVGGSSVDVRQTGANWAEADAYLRSHVMPQEGDGSSAHSNNNAVYVPPFDHPDLWTGAAGIVSELAGQLPPQVEGGQPDAIVCCVGGGSLLCGLMEGLGQMDQTNKATGRRRKQTIVLAMETEGADSLAASIRSGQLVTLPAIKSVATSLGAPRVAEAALGWCQRVPKGSASSAASVVSAVVSDADAVSAVVRFLDDTRLLVEPACGATLAPVYARAPRPNSSGGPGSQPGMDSGDVSLLRHHLGRGLSDSEWAQKHVVLIVCGGANINLDLLAGFRERFNV